MFERAGFNRCYKRDRLPTFLGSGEIENAHQVAATSPRLSPGVRTISPMRGRSASPDSDADGRAMERPQHGVTIRQPFWVARTEVTQAQWEELMGENPYDRDRSNPYYNQKCDVELDGVSVPTPCPERTC